MKYTGVYMSVYVLYVQRIYIQVNLAKSGIIHTCDPFSNMH